jgi:cardiolipin synthase
VRLAESDTTFDLLDSEPLAPVAQAAYLLDGNLYLEVRSQDSTGHRVVRRDATSSSGSNAIRPSFSSRAGTPPVLQIEDLEAEHWRPAKGSPVAVFDASYWQQILRAAQIAVTPTDRRFGAVVNVLDEQDLFHYYDEIGTLRTVPIIYKPESVRVKHTYRLERVIAETMPTLRKTLSEGNQLPAYALINTGDGTEGGFPFVFLDFNRQQAFFLRWLPRDWQPTSPSPLSTTIETAAHVTTSHIVVIFEQPVTALTRLLTLATRTTTGMLDPRGRLPIAQGEIPPVNNGPGMDLTGWEATLDRMTGESASRGRIKTLIDGEEFFPRLIDAVTAAQQSLLLRTYIFDNDDYATGFADLLKRRSTDIDIRVMVDGLGMIGGAAAQPEYQPSAGGSVGSMAEYLQRDSKVKVRVLANPWLTGDHTKSIVVDQRIAFVGGMNIGREYRYEWHDLMVELSGPVVDVVRKDFEKTWVRQMVLGDLLALFKVVKPVNAATDDMYPIRVLTTSARDAQILKAQIAAIRASRQRIYIQNAYFTSDAILYELVMARRRGVDVRVILPLRSDSGLIDRANAIAANKMIANGIRVYIYPGMSHVKGAVYDGWACLGSANFDALSLQVNHELNIATSHPAAVEDLVQRVFLADMEQSVELTEPFPAEWWDFLTGLLADML